MIKQINRNFVKGILFLFMIFSFIVHSKTRIDGSININWGRGIDRNRRDRDRGDYWDNENDGYNYVGDITDNQYNLKPFILNGRGYAIIKDTRYYILQVTFRNGDINRVEKEVVYNTQIFSQNCIAIEGDSRYCLTITSEGSPALWDRYSGRVKYTGRWLKTRTNYYNNSDRFDYDYYQNSEHWFEW
jgi:hypothetical protein